MCVCVCVCRNVKSFPCSAAAHIKRKIYVVNVDVDVAGCECEGAANTRRTFRRRCLRCCLRRRRLRLCLRGSFLCPKYLEYHSLMLPPHPPASFLRGCGSRRFVGVCQDNFVHDLGPGCDDNAAVDAAVVDDDDDVVISSSSSCKSCEPPHCQQHCARARAEMLVVFSVANYVRVCGDWEHRKNTVLSSNYPAKTCAAKGARTNTNT